MRCSMPVQDIFSLGAVLYEMVTGRFPFPGNTAAIIHDGILNRTPQPPSRLNADVPARLDDISLKALEKDPELRYQTARDLRADLPAPAARERAAEQQYGGRSGPSRAAVGSALALCGLAGLPRRARGRCGHAMAHTARVGRPNELDGGATDVELVGKPCERGGHLA